MAGTIMAMGFTIISLWLTWTRIQVRLQSVDKAIENVRHALAKGGVDGEPSKVPFWSAHPLSDHMIKELAAKEGYDYRGEGVVPGSARALEFTRRPGTERRLSLFE
jgi:hypothetical protein